MRIKQPRIQCPTCSGFGQVEVTGVYLETLMALRRFTREYEWTTAAKSAKWLRCSATAANMRFAWLEQHGLATSERYGRERRYRAT
jgi:hypothetical protein